MQDQGNELLKITNFVPNSRRRTNGLYHEQGSALKLHEFPYLNKTTHAIMYLLDSFLK